MSPTRPERSLSRTRAPSSPEPTAPAGSPPPPLASRRLLSVQFGTLSRNKYHGPGSINTNLIIAKNFNLRADGTMRLQIRMESDNVFNHTNFNNPSGGVTSTTNGETLTAPCTLSYGSAGMISGAGLARQTQLAAKFYF